MELLSAPWPLPRSYTSLTALGLFITVFALLFDFMKRRRKWSRYPPGPTPWPFLGNMAQVDFPNLHAYITRLHKKFGDVFSLQFCWMNVVVLNGFEAMKDGLINKAEDTADRPRLALNESFGYKENCSGVVMARYGHAWRDIRRFSLSTLRNFGLGKKSLEERVTEEASFLCSAFAAKEGRPFDPHFVVNNAVSNIICSITFGDRFEYDDKKFLKVLHLLEELIRAGAGFLPQLLNGVPALIHIPGLAQKVFRPQSNLFNFMREIIQEHKKSWDPNMRRDFIDAFLEEIEKGKEDPESSFSETNLLFTAVDLFLAGTETTSTTLHWALLYMILYPGIQSRVQEEIDQVIGRERRPTMDDRANMPYTNAVVHEVQRYGDILPLTVPHMTYRDTDINGFFIPKGTALLLNFTSVLKDESVWERPYQFYPEHFLDTDGQFIKRDAFMPFSAGRRVCLGEQLARMELFLFFVSFLQHFTFIIPRNEPRPTEEGSKVAFRCPHPYKLCALVR